MSEVCSGEQTFAQLLEERAWRKRFADWDVAVAMGSFDQPHTKK